MKWLKDCLNKRFFKIPVYGYIAGIGMFILQRYMYLWANDISLALGIGWHTTKITWLDDLIPLFLPSITVYILSYFFGFIVQWSLRKTVQRNILKIS